MKNNKKKFGKTGVPAKKVIATIVRKAQLPAPVATTKDLMPQRKTNKRMSGKELLAKGMKKIARS